MNSIFNDLIIFEIANNHQGNVNHGLNIIEAIANIVSNYNINVGIKLQYRDLDSFIHPSFLESGANPHVKRFLSTRLSNDEFKLCIDQIKRKGMLAIVTPFDEKSVDLCEQHGVDIIKIASCSFNDWPLIRYAVNKRIPMILSTGGKSYKEIDSVYQFLNEKKSDFAFLHCVGLYPTPLHLLQLDVIRYLTCKYPSIPIGYSGHESPDKYFISQLAIAEGAKILERHVGLSTEGIKLNGYSMDIKDVPKWIESIIDAKISCKTEIQKTVTAAERDSLKSLMRGTYANTHIDEGEFIRRNQVFFAMPCDDNQISSGEYRENLQSTVAYNELDAIKKTEISTSITMDQVVPHLNSKKEQILGVVEKVMDMLQNAKIVLPDHYTIEISHHKGLENFSECGASIINLINRKYCKKLIIVFPGQIHPRHFHKIKEESFHVLFGNLIIETDNNEVSYKAGSIVLVKPGMVHGFRSDEGCIFEEISTTHFNNDSFYIDSSIQDLKIDERKTIINI